MSNSKFAGVFPEREKQINNSYLRPNITQKFIATDSQRNEMASAVWGVSVENRKHGLPRIDALRGAPAKIRFLSIEPLLEDLGTINLAGIDCVIVGGESGWGARPMDPAWVIDIRDQCRAAYVPFFFKQWGGAQKSKHDRLLNNRTYDDMPQRRAGVAPSRSLRFAMIDALTAEVTA